MLCEEERRRIAVVLRFNNPRRHFCILVNLKLCHSVCVSVGFAYDFGFVGIREFRIDFAACEIGHDSKLELSCGLCVLFVLLCRQIFAVDLIRHCRSRREHPAFAEVGEALKLVLDFLYSYLVNICGIDKVVCKSLKGIACFLSSSPCINVVYLLIFSGQLIKQLSEDALNICRRFAVAVYECCLSSIFRDAFNLSRQGRYKLGDVAHRTLDGNCGQLIICV